MKMIGYILGLILSAGSLYAETSYELIPLTNAGYARSINNVGQVTGSNWVDSGYIHSNIYNAGNTIDLGTLGGDYSEGNAINNLGQVVGYATTQTSNYHLMPSDSACLFDTTGNGNNILLANSRSRAYSINNNGIIVGFYSSDNNYRACVFDPSGNQDNINLGTLGGDSVAQSVNNYNKIVGYSYNGDALMRACLFDISGNNNNIDLGTLDGRGESVALCISDVGQIVGYVRPSRTVYEACLFDASGQGNNIGLGSLGGSSFANAINSNGVIVGKSECSYGYGTHACLFDSTGVQSPIDLNTLIAGGTDWTLISAYGINDYGWIVGDARNGEGEICSYMLRPIPEPATLSLLSLGGLFLRRRRKSITTYYQL